MRKKLMLLSALTGSLALALAFGEAPAKSADGEKAAKKEAILAGDTKAPCAKMAADGKEAKCLRKQGAAKAGASLEADCPRGAEADCPPDCDREACLKQSGKAEASGTKPAAEAGSGTDI